MERQISRGDIFYANLEPVVGSEQGGERPVLIIQNDKGNRFSPTVVIAPITSKVHRKRAMLTHVELHCTDLPKDSMALFEQIRTIDKTRLGSYVGKATDENMLEIDRAIHVSTGMQY